METLKRCPFCGDKNPEVHETQRIIDGKLYENVKLYEIWCWQCGARGGVTSGIKAAIKRWNRRADDENND
jgi:Lar family restriction alleviation protein